MRGLQAPRLGQHTLAVSHGCPPGRMQVSVGGGASHPQSPLGWVSGLPSSTARQMAQTSCPGSQPRHAAGGAGPFGEWTVGYYSASL